MIAAVGRVTCVLTVKCREGELYFRWTGLPYYDLFNVFFPFKPVSYLLKAMILKLSVLAEGNSGCLPVSSAQVFTFLLKARDSLL